MSSLSQIGRHLYTIDQSGVVDANTVEDTGIVIVRDYTVVVLSLLSDISLTIDFLWSNDGLDFSFDPLKSVAHLGSPDHTYYERAVSGIFFKYRITNATLSDTTVFSMETYAKAGFNVEINGSIPPPIQEDVWWYRDPADPAETTILKDPPPGPPTNPGGLGNLLYGVATELNVLDPALDYRAQTVVLGNELIFNYNNTQATTYGRRDRAFYRCGGLLNGENVIIANPDTEGVLPILCAETAFAGNPTKAFQNALAACVNNSTIINMRNSLLASLYNTVIIASSDLGVEDDGFYGNNIFFNMFNARLSRNLGPSGTEMRRNVINRLYNGTWQKDMATANYICGTRVKADVIAPPHTIEGVYVITDNTNQDDVTPANYLNLTSTTDLFNKFHARFANGYDFWTDANSTVGMRISPGGNSINPICDNRLKQDFMEYEDTAQILDRMVGCKVQSYHITSLLKSQPEVESKRFRIGPTAQDLHYVFHPEDGTPEEINTALEEECSNSYCEGRRDSMVGGLVEAGELKEGEEPSAEQEAVIQADLAKELETEDVKLTLTKQSLMSLDMQEYVSALHLCIKELHSQLDVVNSRLAVLEAGV